MQFSKRRRWGGALLFVVAVLASHFAWQTSGVTGLVSNLFALPPLAALAWWLWPVLVEKNGERRTLIGTLVFVAAVVFSAFAWRASGMVGPAAAVFAVPPAAALAWWFWTFVQNIGDMDELERQIEVRALAIGGSVAVWIITVYGFVSDMTGLVVLPAFLIAPLVAVCYGITKHVVEKSFR